jgi:hypothetical protein
VILPSPGQSSAGSGSARLLPHKKAFSQLLHYTINNLPSTSLVYTMSSPAPLDAPAEALCPSPGEPRATGTSSPSSPTSLASADGGVSLPPHLRLPRRASPPPVATQQVEAHQPSSAEHLSAGEPSPPAILPQVDGAWVRGFSSQTEIGACIKDMCDKDIRGILGSKSCPGSAKCGSKFHMCRDFWRVGVGTH